VRRIMQKFLRLGARLALAIIVLTGLAVSIQQLTGAAASADCVGLVCSGQSDCGAGPVPPCFCNSHDGRCHLNSQ
jgi:uncharacterized membrane protein